MRLLGRLDGLVHFRRPCLVPGRQQVTVFVRHHGPGRVSCPDLLPAHNDGNVDLLAGHVGESRLQ
jgi:hypothetical protein